MIQKITLADAKRASLKRYFTGIPCKYGHVTERLVSNRGCCKCVRARALKWIKIERRSGGKLHARHMVYVKRRTKHGTTPASINYRIGQKLRIRMLAAVRGNAKIGSAVRDLGCGIFEFREYIEKKFKDGMSLDNHGEWHFDHIRPLASFDLTDRNQFLAACHFTNYQPLWVSENFSKGSRVT